MKKSESTQNEKGFKVGDIVSWSSQAAGTTTTKVGTVVEVVPAGREPTKMARAVGSTRKHVSYVVDVPRFAKKSKQPLKPESYWPIVSLLSMHVVDGANNARTDQWASDAQ